MPDEKFEAEIGDVLDWDQKVCSVLLIPGGPGPADFMRAHRGAKLEVTVTLVGQPVQPPAPAPPPPAAKPAALPGPPAEPPAATAKAPKARAPKAPPPAPAPPAQLPAPAAKTDGQGELFGKGRRWGRDG